MACPHMARPYPWASKIWCLCLGLCSLSASGVHVPAVRRPFVGHTSMMPTGPQVTPVGRHIQYCFQDHPHGLTDRMWIFRGFVALGKYHNAKVHIAGGGPRAWLHEMHSADAAESWGRYFNLRANGGNPFHELESFRGCATLDGPYGLSDLLELFDHGELCVNIVHQWPFKRGIPKELARLNPDLPVSAFVKGAAQRFLQRYEVEDAYGSCHIRRCDMFLGHQNCTNPAKIYQELAKGPKLHTWLFFMYAEETYSKELRAKLAPLGRRLLFEDDVVLNDHFPEDNYFTYLVGKYLNGGADTIIETHLCVGSTPYVLNGSTVSNHGIFMIRDARGSESEAMDVGLDEMQDAFSAAEEEYHAVCDAAQRGAHLVKNETQKQKKWSTSPV